MAKRKVFSEETKNVVLKNVRARLKSFESKDIDLQVGLYYVLYKKTFKAITLPGSFAHGRRQLESYIFISSKFESLTNEEIEQIYQNELMFIGQVFRMPSTQPFLTRLLIKDYIMNMNNYSLWGIPGSKYALGEERSKDYQNQLLEIFTSTFSLKQKPKQMAKRIPKTTLQHILTSPFYSLDLKLIILKSEDPQNRKRLSDLINVGYPQTEENRRLAALLKIYIITFYESGLSKELIGMDKKLPIKDSRVYEIISDITGEPSTEVIAWDLRKIFSK